MKNPNDIVSLSGIPSYCFKIAIHINEKSWRKIPTYYRREKTDTNDYQQKRLNYYSKAPECLTDWLYATDWLTIGIPFRYMRDNIFLSLNHHFIKESKLHQRFTLYKVVNIRRPYTNTIKQSVSLLLLFQPMRPELQRKWTKSKSKYEKAKDEYMSLANFIRFWLSILLQNPYIRGEGSLLI